MNFFARILFLIFARCMEKSDSPYIAQTLRNIERIQKYVGAMTFVEFEKDDQKQSAVLMQLQLIGELAKRVSLKAREEMKTVPWQKITGFRDVIAHDYYRVQLPTVWSIIAEDLVAIEVPLAEYLKQHPLPPQI